MEIRKKKLVTTKYLTKKELKLLNSFTEKNIKKGLLKSKVLSFFKFISLDIILVQYTIEHLALIRFHHFTANDHFIPYKVSFFKVKNHVQFTNLSNTKNNH